MKNTILIQETNFNKLKEEVKKNSNKTIIFSSNNDELNRKVLEKLPIQILLINLANRKDKPKQRDSGFNHVLAKIAKKKNIIIGINLDEIINSKNEAEIFARISQNIKLCNKNKLKMKFISFKQKRNIYDLEALGLVLGMPTSMTRLLDSDKHK